MANTTNPYVPKPVYETCVTRIIGEHKCLWYSNYRPDVHKMEKLMESNPDDVKIVLDYRNETGEDGDHRDHRVEGRPLLQPAPWTRESPLTHYFSSFPLFSRHHSEKSVVFRDT